MTAFCRVNFELRYNLKRGEKLILSGSSLDLGNWNPISGYFLKKNPKTQNLWFCSLLLKKGSTYSYKYLIEKEEFLNSEIVTKKSYRWESPEKVRKIKVFGNQMVVNDFFLEKYLTS